MSITENTNTLYEGFFTLVASLRQRMENEGISQEVVDKIIGSPSEGETVSVPQGRFLQPNTSAPISNATKNNTNEKAKADATATNKAVSWIGKTEVVVILDYSDKENAIFGDFVKAYNSFKDKYLKDNHWFRYHNKLVFGAGWRMLDKTKMPELRKAFKAANIPFREVTRKDYEKESSSGKSTPNIEEVSDNEETVSPPKVVQTVAKKEAAKPEVKSIPPKKGVKEAPKVDVKPEPVKPLAKKGAKVVDEPAPEKRKILRNGFGNFEEAETGLVFIKLPVGAGGKLVNVCVGYQNPEPEKGETGNETIFALTKEHIDAAIAGSHKILDDEMIEKVREKGEDEEKYKELADQLDDISVRGIDAEDELADDDEGDVGEDEDELDEDDEDDA